jgi:hypothetical protein
MQAEVVMMLNISFPNVSNISKKKMTLGWVVNGERRHTERQGELPP